ncbi:acyltransferase family protein [Herbaspirillum huttiense]|uniref:acyltransferase family protein n=1 Tax=Herbaspirillum huttiense TaxID=863372 RepID=UPI0039AF22EF
MVSKPPDPARSAERREIWIDYLKAIGIILVVYGHVARGVYNAAIPLDQQRYQLIDSIIYSFHMPLFFFASGLTVANSLAKYGTAGFIMEKLRTLAYPYFVWSLIQGLIGLLLSRLTNRQLELASLLQIPWHPQDQFWFLYALLLIMMVLALLVNWLGLQRRYWLLALFTAGFIFHVYFPFTMVDGFVLSYGVYTVLGLCFADFRGRLMRHAHTLAPLLVCVAIIAQYVFHISLQLRTDPDHKFTLPLAVVCILALVALSMRMELLSRWNWMREIGRLSMPIFLMHILFGSGARIVMNKVLHLQDPLVHLIVGTAAGVLLPMVAYRVLINCKAGYLFALPDSPQHQLRRN